MSTPTDNLHSALSEMITRMVDRSVRERLDAEQAERHPQAQSGTSNLPAFVDAVGLAEMLQLGTRDAHGRRPGGIRTIRAWMRAGRIPYRRAGGRVLFLVSEILDWTAQERDRHEQ